MCWSRPATEYVPRNSVSCVVYTQYLSVLLRLRGSNQPLIGRGTGPAGKVAARDGPKQQPSDGINPRYKAWSTGCIVLSVMPLVARPAALQYTDTMPGASPFSARRSIRANLPCPYKEAPESCFTVLLFFSLLSLCSFFIFQVQTCLFLKLSLVLFDFGQSLFSVLTNYHHSLSSTNYFLPQKQQNPTSKNNHNAFHCCFRCSLRRPCCRRPSG